MRVKHLGAIVIIGMAGSGMQALAQSNGAPKTQPAATSTFKGCLQGDSAKGFALMSPTGDATKDAKGQMKMYKIVAGSGVSLSQMANKLVEVSGTLDTAATGKIPSPDVMGDRKI